MISTQPSLPPPILTPTKLYSQTKRILYCDYNFIIRPYTSS